MSNVVQRTFAGGEIAPALFARTDLIKYATGLRTCRNFFIEKQGTAANRPGTALVAGVKNSAKTSRLWCWHFNDDQTYLVELGPGYMRWFQDAAAVELDETPDSWVTATAYVIGDLVANDAVNYYCTADHTSASTTEPGTGDDWSGSWYALIDDIYEIPTPYAEADLMALQLSQSADVVTIAHRSYATRELKRFGDTLWTLSLTAFGPSTGKPTTLAATGGAVDTSDATYAVTAIDEVTGEEGLPATKELSLKEPTSSSAITLTWDALAGAVEFNVYRSADGVSYGLIGVAGGLEEVTSDTTWTTGDASVQSTTTGSEVEGTTQARNPVVATAAGKAFDGKYRVTGTIEVSSGLEDTDAVAEGWVNVYYQRGSETRVLAGSSDVVDSSGGAGTGAVPFSLTIEVPDNGYTTLTIDLVPVIEIASGTGSVSMTCKVVGTKIESSTVGTGFIDDGIEPDYTVSPPRERNLFTAVGGYPGVVGSYQQRRAFANSTSQPERIWMSRVGLPRNFLRTMPIGAADPVIFTLAGNEVNEVRHFLDLETLLIFTAGDVKRAEGDDTGTIVPGAPNPKRFFGAGAAATPPPIVAGKSAIYVQARGSIVRSLLATAAEGWTGSDLTIFASHLVEGRTLVDGAFAETPNSIVWFVRSDGVLLGLTYLKEQEVWGWHRHDTDGLIERVCVVPEDSEDRVYLIVKRTIDGSTKRYIERMASRRVSDIRDAVFVDSALSYDGRNTGTTTMTLSGGTDWDYEETLTLTASASLFVAGDVGNEIHLESSAGDKVRFVIDAYSSGTVVTGHAVKDVPTSLRATATTTWARAVDTFSGLSHLEGKDVAVLGDGYVAASPNNSSYGTVTVDDGSITLDRCYAVVHVGLPYISDLETLDIDTPQGPSLKDKRMLVNRVGLFVEASRGIWAGPRAPTGDDPLEGLSEYPSRNATPEGGEGDSYDTPPELVTDYVDIGIQSDWSQHGRVLVRQVDPLPLSVLSVTPQGYMPTGG